MDRMKRIGRTGLMGVVAGAVLASSLVLAQPAAAANICNARNCGANQTRISLDCKTCKPTKKRPAIQVCRAVCEKPNGKLKKKHMPKCPKVSPSTGCTN
jgi:hypothetical protein